MLAMPLACSGPLTSSLPFLQYFLPRDSKEYQCLEAKKIYELEESYSILLNTTFVLCRLK